MNDQYTEQEYKTRAGAVKEYISSHLSEDLSLDVLAGVANYSSYHLQKVFKQVTGETPKQYIIRLRLEAALHLLIIHPRKTIREICADCGFSSASVFSRAAKNYFGIAPEEMRTLSPQEKINIFRDKNLPLPQQARFHLAKPARSLSIRVKKMEAVAGFYLLASATDAKTIQQAFAEAKRVAATHQPELTDLKFYGIADPFHSDMYKTFIATDPVKLPRKVNRTEIKAGWYATFSIKGSRDETTKAGRFFYHDWLPESGYKVTGATGFETFDEDPAVMPYEKLERHIYISIEPSPVVPG